MVTSADSKHGKRPVGCDIDIVDAYLWWIYKDAPQSNIAYRHGGGPYRKNNITGCGRGALLQVNGHGYVLTALLRQVLYGKHIALPY